MIRDEMALHLPDVLQRRSALAIRGQLTLPLIRAVAAVMADELGWTATRSAEEIARFVTELETWHGVSLNHTEGETP